MSPLIHVVEALTKSTSRLPSFFRGHPLICHKGLATEAYAKFPLVTLMPLFTKEFFHEGCMVYTSLSQDHRHRSTLSWRQFKLELTKSLISLTILSHNHQNHKLLPKAMFLTYLFTQKFISKLKHARCACIRSYSNSTIQYVSMDL